MFRHTAAATLHFLLVSSLCIAQAVDGRVGGVPPVIRFGGTLAAATGSVTVTFAVYADQVGGEALWEERQTVTTDETGRYAVLLGGTTAFPADLFARGEPRWLGVDAAGMPSLPRVLLVSVPYALKSGDTDTIGGHPLSAFVLAGEKTGIGPDGLTYVDTRALQAGPPSPQGAVGAAGSGATHTAATASAHYLARFNDDTSLGDSAFYQSPAGRVALNTNAPQAPFHVVAPETPGAFFDVFSGAGVLGALPVVHRAARGTSAMPAAVQIDDILGGLAVRAYTGAGFSGGRGQVMFKAAENWTPTANGTYLSMATVPLGGVGPAVERIRVDPGGNVGIGTTAPGQRLSVAGAVESTTGGFKFPDGSVQASAAGAVGGTYDFNTAVGENALVANTDGLGNTAVGSWALAHNTSGSSNTATGSYSLAQNTTGSSNTATGAEALTCNTSGTGNTATGVDAMQSNVTGNKNTAYGVNALWSNTTGSSNSAVGYQSLFADTASENSAFGYQSLTANTTGTGVSAFGHRSLAANTTGLNNTAVGFEALLANVTSSSNTAVGYRSLAAATGVANTAVGANALLNASGGYNVAVGSGALADVTTGGSNVGVGYNSGNYLAAGTYNTFIGNSARAGSAVPDLTYAGAIGANAVVTQDHSIVLGGTGLAAVNVGINTTAPDTRLQVVGDIKVGTSGTNGCVKNFAGTGLIGTCSSDLRLKANVAPFEPMLDRVARLRPVRFTWKAAEFPEYHFGAGISSGLIAQDVEQVFPELVATDERGFKMVNYSELPYLTLAAVKELKAGNDSLRVENDELRTRVEALERLIASLLKDRQR
jgi:hypothetical protein